MTELIVQIIDLKPMEIAKAHIKSRTPELDAWKLVQRFLNVNNLNGNGENSIFGIQSLENKTSDEYEYEYWVRIKEGQNYHQVDGVSIEKFDGGKYAVTRTDLDNDLDGGFIVSWSKLQDWAISHNFIIEKGPHFEKPLSNDVFEKDMILDLYLKIKE